MSLIPNHFGYKKKLYVKVAHLHIENEEEYKNNLLQSWLPEEHLF